MTLADWFSDRLGLASHHQRYAVRAMQTVLAGVTVAGLVTVRPGLFLTGAIPLLVTLAPGYLRRDHDVPLDVGWTLWITTAALLHVVGALWAYDTVGWYDQVAHAISGALVALCGYVLLHAVTLYSDEVVLDDRFSSAFVVVVVLAVGVGWELAEYATELIARRVGGEAALVVRGPDDVALDLLFDAIGALVVAAWNAAPVRSVGRVLARLLDGE